jgi:homoserine O-succinyltransferase
MPLCLDEDPSTYHPLAGVKFRSNDEFDECSSKCIHVGLINNMPDGALQATERQFLTLLDSAAGDVLVRLSLYSIPEVPRAEWGRAHVARFYSDIDDLWDRQLDGLIVTGTEPRASNLTEEPYWQTLTSVLEWADHRTYSTICSCLAAHAAVLHMDGIGRRRLSDKRCGVFELEPGVVHQLTAGISAPLRVPHSRWNDIPGDVLEQCGYRVLMRANDAGVDTFMKQRKSLFVFFQGHPEYEANTLLLEYRRDVGRYLRGDRDTYPQLPDGYFDRNTIDALTEVRERAMSDRCEELIADFPTALIEKEIANTWRPMAVRLYGNWLTLLCAQKERRLKKRQYWKHLQAREVGLTHALPRAEAK